MAVHIAFVLALMVGACVHGQKIDGGLSPWTDTTACSVTCGGGVKSQSRTCNNPAPSGGGLPCDPEQPTSRQVNCNTNVCVACQYMKPCSCNNVPKFQTGSEPDASLSYFSNVNSNDIETAKNYLNLWTNEYFQKFCKDAQCDSNKLTMAITNMTTYVNNLKALDDYHRQAREQLHKIIDCNDNVNIEGNLWNVYDVLCDSNVAISEIREDLQQKKTMLEDEKQRCESLTWIGKNVQRYLPVW